MMAKLLPLSIGLATGALVLSYAMHGLWAAVFLISPLGLLWLLGQWRGWRGLASVTFVVFVGAAVVGLWLDVPETLMLLAVVAALTAWDLDHFARRLRVVERVEGAQSLERHHLQRLFIVDGLGVVLSAAALGFEVKLSFGAAFLLGLLMVLAVSRAIGSLRSAITH